MKKYVIIMLALVAVVFFSCKKDYDLLTGASVQAVLEISQGGVKSTTAQGDSAKKDRVTIFDGSKSTGPIKSYSMTFGDGTSTGIINVSGPGQVYSSHIFTQFGQYDVTLTVFSGENGTGAQSTAHKTVWVVDNGNPPPPSPNDILVLIDSTWNPVTQKWTCNFKVQSDKAFYDGCPGPFFYKGDQNGWTANPLVGNLIDGWYYFSITADKYGHRFTVIIYNNTIEVWARITPDVNQNETTVSKWNVYGCFEVIGLPSRITPAYTPGLRGDQQVSLEPAGVGFTRINIKDLNFRWPNKIPGICFLKQYGWETPIALTPNPSDPYGRWSYTIVSNAEFFWTGNPYNGVCFFQLLPDYSSTAFTHIWTGSYFYFAGNPTNNPSIPACFAFQTTIFK